MHRKALIAVGGAAASLATGSLLVAGPAFGAGKTHTLHLKGHQISKGTVTFSASKGVRAYALKSSGKAVGTTVLSCNSTSTVIKCKGALALKGGILDGTVNVSTTTLHISGKITGGSGAYKGASGKISGAATSATAVSLTVTYKR